MVDHRKNRIMHSEQNTFLFFTKNPMMRAAALALVAIMGTASAFSVAPSGSALDLRRAPLCSSRAGPQSPRSARALAVRMQEGAPNPVRQGLVALAPILGFALFIEYVAAPLMLEKLKAEKAEKAAKEGQK